MALSTRPLTVLVCDSDPLVSRTFGQVAADQGFEVCTPAENGAQLLDLLSVVHPSLVIVTNELHGMTGTEVLEVIAGTDGGPEVILVTSDERARDEAQGVALAVADRFDVEELQAAINLAKYLFETGERRTRADRRSGTDRRQQQDWSKVTHERRVEQRRKGPRRAEEVGGEPQEWVDRRKEQDWSKVTVERRQSLPQRPKHSA
jgi:DNA-binding response OmpR family regulator